MNPKRIAVAIQATVAVLTALAITGCEKKISVTPPGNIPPTVRLTQAPFNDNTSYFYAFRMNWLGYDPDGRVEFFLYAVDPPLNGAPIDWVKTTKNEQILFFTAKDSLVTSPERRSVDFHTFAIVAVDDDGDSSEVVTRSFFSYTVAPTVNLTNPRPNPLLAAQLTPAVRISWTGTDPDGQFTTKPIKYKYILLSSGSGFPLEVAIGDPDSLRRRFAPNFAGWDSTPGDTTQVQFTNLTPGADFVFAVVAFDEAGAYSPIFSLSSNVLRFRVGFAGTLGPIITMFNEFFNFTYSSGGYSTDPQREVFLEVPAGEIVKFNWFALPPSGSDMESYRWSLDIADVSNNTPRDDEENDVTRWSSASLLTQTATVGPFNGGEEHRFYIEALDNNGLRSLGIVRFLVVESTLENDLLIVDDTRFIGDEQNAGEQCVRPPIGAWPTAAELDTFLFARGGKPWRCYPGAILSEPGLFAGYDFDTLGTRTGANEAVVRLAKLGQYAHVVWIVDAKSAVSNKPGSDPFNPITSLRYMSGPGRFNALAAYVKQGGKVWMVGGGTGYASIIPWNNNNNDSGGITFANSQGELVPGRFMYDLVGWRSEFKVATVSGFLLRTLGRNPQWPGVPPYANLPFQMRRKTAATDPFPPNRPGQANSVFYKTTFDVEFLSVQNFVVEDIDPDPDVSNEQSVLDTLYWVRTTTLPASTATRVCMTYYHSTQSSEFMFTGFDIWDHARPDCQALVDFVLQDVWGLVRTAAVDAPAAYAPRPATLRQSGQISGSAGLPSAGARQVAAGRANSTRE